MPQFPSRIVSAEQLVNAAALTVAAERTTDEEDGWVFVDKGT
jgi:hypothetical protein